MGILIYHNAVFVYIAEIGGYISIWRVIQVSFSLLFIALHVKTI
jgi:hypothetical protein